MKTNSLFYILCFKNICFFKNRQLPEESNLFSQVDSKWKDLMKRTEDNPNALRATTTAGVFETLQTNNAHLEKIQKALEVNNTKFFNCSGSNPQKTCLK